MAFLITINLIDIVSIRDLKYLDYKLGNTNIPVGQAIIYTD